MANCRFLSSGPQLLTGILLLGGLLVFGAVLARRSDKVQIRASIADSAGEIASIALPPPALDLLPDDSEHPPRKALRFPSEVHPAKFSELFEFSARDGFWSTEPLPLPDAAPATRASETRVEVNVVYSRHALLHDERHIIAAADYVAFRSVILDDPSNVIMPLPACTCKSGESRFAGVARKPPDKTSLAVGASGLAVEVTPTLQDDGVLLSVNAGYGIPSGHGSGPDDAGTAAGERAAGHSHALLNTGDILVTSLREVEKDCHATVFTRVTKLDPTGIPIDAPSHSRDESLPGERVRLRAAIATFPLTDLQKRYRDELNKKRKGLPATPSRFVRANARGCEDPEIGVPYFGGVEPCVACRLPADTSAWLLEKAGDSVEALEAVEISTGGIEQPWKDLELKLTLTMSRSLFSAKMGLTLPRDKGHSGKEALQGDSWVVELPPLSPESRRLLVITPEWLR